MTAVIFVTDYDGGSTNVVWVTPAADTVGAVSISGTESLTYAPPASGAAGLYGFQLNANDPTITRFGPYAVQTWITVELLAGTARALVMIIAPALTGTHAPHEG